MNKNLLLLIFFYLFNFYDLIPFTYIYEYTTSER